MLQLPKLVGNDPSLVIVDARELCSEFLEVLRRRVFPPAGRARVGGGARRQQHRMRFIGGMRLDVKALDVSDSLGGGVRPASA